MITIAPETLDQIPKDVGQEKKPPLESSEKSLERLKDLFKKPNANSKIRSTDLRYKKDGVLLELGEISLQLIDELPNQTKPSATKEQTLGEQFHHLVARHCDAATSEIGATVDKEIKFPGIYDYSLNVSMEKVGENEISTTFELQSTK